MENTAVCDVHFAYPHPIHKSKTLKCAFKNILENFSSWLGDSTMSKYSTVKILRGRRQFDAQQLFWLQFFLNCAIKLRLRQYILMQNPRITYYINIDTWYNIYEALQGSKQSQDQGCIAMYCIHTYPMSAARTVPPLPAETTWQRASNQHFTRLYKR